MSDTTTKSRPIIFAAHSVRAILDGTKTMTRRVMKPQPSEAFSGEVGVFHPTKIARDGEEYPGDPIFGVSSNEEGYRCPYGGPGDLLWVKEGWRKTFDINDTDVLEYRCGGTRLITEDGICQGTHRLTSVAPKWCSPLFMPRKFARLTLEITGVKVERVQDISEADAIAEGVNPAEAEIQGGKSVFHERWDALNGKKPDCSWAENPYVWCVAFNKIEGGLR